MKQNSKAEASLVSAGFLALAETAANEDMMMEQSPPARKYFPLLAKIGKRTVGVKLSVEGAEYIPTHLIGHDGNRYFCQACNGTGEIVCCDGCPCVYHPACVPNGTKSRLSLDADDDPWYCPNCIDSSKKQVQKGANKSAKSPPVATTTTQPRKEDDYDMGVDIEKPDVMIVGTSSVTPLITRLRKRKKGVGKSSSNKKRREHLLSIGQEGDEDMFSPGEYVSPSLGRNEGGPVQAIPAFYLFLKENRTKVERALARRVRKFSSLPKGPERYELIAKEAANWWVKLRPMDHRRYVNMSIRDFEARVMDWKEEKDLHGIQGQVSSEDDVEESSSDAGSEDHKFGDDEERARADRHRRLFLNTSVGSRLFQLEKDQNYNTVLMDLLQDARFHTMPLFSENREEQDFLVDDGARKYVIPHFEVHGPYSTSIGDECLGCCRGWRHYCPVVKRNLPPIDERSKLHPPLSSMSATRVGVGLRPQLMKEKVRAGKETNSEAGKIANLPVVLSGTLDHPSARVDDTVRFYEEVTSMKIPDPRQTSKSNVDDDGGQNRLRCGRCRNFVASELGCVDCRRALLVINLSKADPQDDSNPFFDEETNRLLRVRTVLHPRLQQKYSHPPELNEIDEEMRREMLEKPWMNTSIAKSVRPPGSKGDRQSISSTGAIVSEDNSDSPGDRVEKGRKSQQGRTRRRALDGMSHEEKLQKARCKILQTACFGSLRALKRRDPMDLLIDVPTLNYEEDDNPPINERMAKRIFRDIDSGRFQTFDDFENDLRAVCKRNMEDSDEQESLLLDTAKKICSELQRVGGRAKEWISKATTMVDRLLREDGSALDELLTNGNWLTDNFSAELLEEAETSPEVAQVLQCAPWYRNLADLSFHRTKENESALYGALAVRRVALASELALAPYPDTAGPKTILPYRTEDQDSSLQKLIEERVKAASDPLSMQLQELPSSREEAVVRLLRSVQSRRVDKKVSPKSGCSRSDPITLDVSKPKEMDLVYAEAGPSKRRRERKSFVDQSRHDLTTGLGSQRNNQTREERAKYSLDKVINTMDQVQVSVRESSIHGRGLFADQPFAEGHFVAEYIGERMSAEVWSKRKIWYAENRVKPYYLEVDGSLFLDATKRGGSARFVNHSCSPNCEITTIDDKESSSKSSSKKRSKRVFLVAKRAIESNEEITFDYDIPLEKDLSSRKACFCGAEQCQGFMNWKFPEEGMKVGGHRTSKTGSSMRDRIRRLNRPLKRGESL